MRKTLIGEHSSALKKDFSNDGAYDVDIKEMFIGNRYFAYVYDTLGDVRLVGTHQVSVVKYGV